MSEPWIVSVGTTPVGRSDLTGRDLLATAVAEAFEDLPDPAEIVDGLYVGNQSEAYEHQIMHGTMAAEWCGLRNVPAERVEACAASGALALQHAVRDVRAGDREAVLACGIEKMTSGSATDVLAAAFERSLEQRSGITAPAAYALLARRYLHETDATETDLARIAVKNHRNAAANPRAQFRSEIDVETVLDSPPVAPPIKLYDCAPISDGSAAVLVATEETAARLVDRDERVRVAGAADAVATLAVAERDLTFPEGARAAAERAFDEAGVSPDQVDVAEVHDAFTVCEALLSEAVGFAPRGRGFEAALDPEDRSDGWTDVRLSTSGGLKARGHPTGATGLYQATEAYEQLTATADPDRQVDGATTALLVNEGGVADAATVAHVLAA